MEQQNKNNVINNTVDISPDDEQCNQFTDWDILNQNESDGDGISLFKSEKKVFQGHESSSDYQYTAFDVNNSIPQNTFNIDEISVSENDADDVSEDLNFKKFPSSSKEKFVGINELYDASPDGKKQKELTKIDTSLRKIIQMMNKYIADADTIWENQIVPFLLSEDCLILENLRVHEYNKFRKFMRSQKVYRLMAVAQNRLIARRNYLLNNN